MFSIIAAIGENGEIGKDNRLLWHIPEDLKNFKKITDNKTVIMGRKTFESIGKPLPGRNNAVLSKTIDESEEKKLGIKIFNNFDSMKDYFKKGKEENEEEIFIIGGEELYKMVLEEKLVDRMYISHIKYSNSEADAYFPEIDFKKWEVVEEKEYKEWKFCLYKKNF